MSAADDTLLKNSEIYKSINSVSVSGGRHVNKWRHFRKTKLDT